MKKKNWLSLMLSVLLVLSLLAGCGAPAANNDPAPEDPAPETQTPDTTETSDPAPAAPQSNTEPVEMVQVKVAPGTLLGYRDNDFYAFRGIPYATAERFQSPEPITSYDKELQFALTYGPVSPQDRTLSAAATVNEAEFMTPTNGTADMVGNEICQYLNVWTGDLSGSKPVVVFFHGGALNNGSSSELSYYTGEYLVQKEDVVFVSVNHRLNVLGYLDMSAYGDQFASSAIAGMEDCVVALQWVQDNIAAFGGDPSNVTIVGQSGGGTKAVTLACMSDTIGLFDKVFIMSSNYSAKDKTAGLANTQKLVNFLGLAENEVAETLVNMDYEDLYRATVDAGCNWSVCYGNGSFGAPFIGDDGSINEYAAARKWIIGTVYGELTTTAQVIVQEDLSHYLPDITDEVALERLTEQYGDRTDAIVAEFAKAYPDKVLGEALYLNANPSGFRSRSYLINNVLDTLSSAGLDVYNYVVSYKPPYFGGTTMYHSGDVGYWYYALETIPYQIRGDEANAYAVADKMSAALAAFAATGDPSTSNLQWKPWTASEHNTMVFDVNSELKVDFDTELYNLIMAQ